MDLIIVATLAIEYGCEVVSPLGTCLDPTWLTHCLDKRHPINDSCLPVWQWSSGMDILWLRDASFGWQLLQVCA